MAKHSDYQASKKLLPPTPSDILGPFYRPGAPARAEFTDKPTLTLAMRVMDQNGDSISGACCDVWHADESGNYDNDSQAFRFRGKMWTTQLAPAHLKTVIPGDYKISDPGQPDDFRCAHIHVIVTADGFKKLTTQLYLPGDPYNATDHWFDQRRVITPPHASFDFVLEMA